MKKLIGSILLLLSIGGLSSCSHDLDAEDDGNKRGHEIKDKDSVKTFVLSFGGDFVTMSEEPLMRAEDGDIYTGINVYRKEKKDGAKEEMYAYGLFKKKDGISIDIMTGYTYRFEASILIEREDKIEITNGTYSDPFRLHDKTSTGFDNAWGFVAKNTDKFQYTYLNPDENTTYLCQLNSGVAYVNTGGDLVDDSGATIRTEWMQYPRVKRFYGKLDMFDPESKDQIEISMAYKSFGLRFELVKIPEGTSITVKDVTTYSGSGPEDNPHLLFPKNLSLNFSSEESKSWEGIYSLRSLNKDTQNFTLRFYWNKGSGKKEYFDQNISVTAKNKKILKLNIDGEVNETKAGNIIFTNMEDDLEDQDPEIVSKDFRTSN